MGKLARFAGGWLAAVTLLCAAASADGFDGNVTTVAGSGGVGFADGSAPAATFAYPVGIAVDGHGTIYVADAGSQRIRTIRAGVVATLAGGGDFAAGSFWVRGGYRDGRGAGARFNFPAGVAVDASSRVYVADAQNHCIRVVAPNGEVTTFAGSASEAGHADGPRAAARFMRPMGVAVSPSGDVYVADQGVGLRKIDASGNVTTPLAEPGATGVAVSPDGRGVVLARLTGGLTFLLDGSLHDIPDSEPLFGGVDVLHLQNLSDVGHPFAATMYDTYRTIYTDAKNGAIRYLDFKTEMSKVLVGDRQLDGTNDDTGYRDGPLAQAAVADPLGVAMGPAGTVLVADSGNRRIRKIGPLNFREATIATIEALPPAVANDGAKHIVVVGNSYVWTNCVWDDCWEGLLEKKLRAAGKPATIYPVQMNAAAEKAMLEYLGTVVPGIPNVNLALFVMNRETIATSGPDWRATYVQGMRAAKAALAANGVKLLVVIQPEALDLDWPEFSTLRFLSGSAVYPIASNPLDPGSPPISPMHAEMLAATREAGVDCVDLFPYFVARARSGTGQPLYGTSEGHMSYYGRKVFADAVFAALGETKY